jgi:hypothetical protein
MIVFFLTKTLLSNNTNILSLAGRSKRKEPAGAGWMSFLPGKFLWLPDIEMPKRRGGCLKMKS